MKALIDQLSNQLSALENPIPHNKILWQWLLQGGVINPPKLMLDASADRLVSQMAKISNTLSSQQKLIERRERNMIVMGVNKCGEDPSTFIKDLFENKLCVEVAGQYSCKWLGKQRNDLVKPRPILVIFNSVDDKHQVTYQIERNQHFLDNDLTKEELLRERKLRDLKRVVVKNEYFKNKRITLLSYGLIDSP